MVMRVLETMWLFFFITDAIRNSFSFYGRWFISWSKLLIL